MDILTEIIKKRALTVPSREESQKWDLKPVTINVTDRLKNKGRLNLIAEIKKKSPSKGSINESISIPGAVELYQPFASAISVLTEPEYFGGSLHDLKEASRLTDIPLLRKDFLTDPMQVLEARAYGASFFLLIQAALSKLQVQEMIAAGKEYNMPALVEVHNEKELELAFENNIEILGINNRNLHDLSIDLNTTQRLVQTIPARLQSKIVIVSESGLSTKGDLDKLPALVDAVLIGTSFMSSNNPENLLKEMFPGS